MNLPSDAQIGDILQDYGVSSGSEMCERIRTYISLLLRWNQAISLTTVTNSDEILRFHFGESLFAASAFSLENGRLADVGSGAGFPGLPIAMLSPDLKVTLIESNAKKFTFLSEAVRELALPNAVPVRSRIEDFKRQGPPFDFITARALGQFKTLLDWSQGQFCESGMLLLWLGKDDLAKLSTKPGWIWSKPIVIPGSERRFLLSGSPVR